MRITRVVLAMMLAAPFTMFAVPGTAQADPIIDIACLDGGLGVWVNAHVPQSNRPVLAGGGERGAVPAERHIGHGVGVAGEGFADRVAVSHN